MVISVEARPQSRYVDRIPGPLWLLPALWLSSAVVLDVAQHHRLASRGALFVNGAIGAVGAAWIVSGVLYGYRGSRVVARVIYAVAMVAGATRFLANLADHHVALATASLFVGVAALVSWQVLGMAGAWLDARTRSVRLAESSGALLAASVIAVGVASAITTPASTSVQSGDTRVVIEKEAWRQLAAISTTDADAASTTLVTNVLRATTGDPTRVAFLTYLAGRVGDDRLGDIADRDHDGRDDDGLVSLRLPSGQLATCLELTSYPDGRLQSAPVSLSRCP